MQHIGRYKYNFIVFTYNTIFQAGKSLIFAEMKIIIANDIMLYTAVCIGSKYCTTQQLSLYLVQIVILRRCDSQLQN